LNFDGNCDYLDIETGQLIHNLDSKTGRSAPLFFAHFGAPPVFEVKEFDKGNRKSLSTWVQQNTSG
jgi:hypothetical protein